MNDATIKKKKTIYKSILLQYLEKILIYFVIVNFSNFLSFFLNIT